MQQLGNWLKDVNSLPSADSRLDGTDGCEHGTAYTGVCQPPTWQFGKWLPFAEYAANNGVLDMTKFTPIFSVYGCTARWHLWMNQRTDKIADTLMLIRSRPLCHKSMSTSGLKWSVVGQCNRIGRIEFRFQRQISRRDLECGWMPDKSIQIDLCGSLIWMTRALHGSLPQIPLWLWSRSPQYNMNWLGTISITSWSHGSRSSRWAAWGTPSTSRGRRWREISGLRCWRQPGISKSVTAPNTLGGAWSPNVGTPKVCGWATSTKTISSMLPWETWAIGESARRTSDLRGGYYHSSGYEWCYVTMN